jgi:hypothetical protein
MAMKVNTLALVQRVVYTTCTKGLIMLMPRMRFFLLFVTLGFCFILPLAAQDISEYSNARFGLSFSYPRDWRPEEFPQKLVVRSPEWAENAREKAAFGIQLTPLEYAEDKSEKEYFEELMQEGSYTHGEPDTVIIDNKEWYHARVTEPEKNISGELFLLKYNHTLYVMVIAYQPPESSARFKPVLETIVRSLKLTDVSGS